MSEEARNSSLQRARVSFQRRRSEQGFICDDDNMWDFRCRHPAHWVSITDVRCMVLMKWHRSTEWSHWLVYVHMSASNNIHTQSDLPEELLELIHGVQELRYSLSFVERISLKVLVPFFSHMPIIHLRAKMLLRELLSSLSMSRHGWSWTSKNLHVYIHKMIQF